MEWNGPLEELRAHLAGLPPGLIEDRDQLLRRLQPAWGSFAGGSSEAMAAYKLDRLEDPGWAPPRLSFVVERHGGTVMGSTRAELQYWRVDLDTAEATASEGGWRQVRPKSPPLNVSPLADRVAESVLSGVDDDWLQWSADRSKVGVRIGRVIPADGPRETLEGRRRRLRVAVKERLAAGGWVETSANRFRLER